MIKDNHETEITETNEATQPAPATIPKKKNGAGMPEKETFPEYQKKRKTNPILDRITSVAFEMEFLKDPDEAIARWQPDKYTQWVNKQLLEIVIHTAELTDSTLEHILEPKTRTPEQEKIILDTINCIEVNRMSAFFNSNYMKALKSLKEIKGQFQDTHEDDAGYISTKELSVIVFFAMHENISPSEKANLTQEQLDEIQHIFTIVDKFLCDNGELTGERLLIDVVECICKEFSITDKEEIIEKITTQPVGSFLFPVDKVNGSIWDNKDDISTTAITIPLKAEPDNSKRQVTNTVMLCLDELKDNSAIQRLTQYDLRVYMAIGNLYNAGNNKISIKDIYKAMGNTKNPAPDQRKKILISIEKMSSIRITIDTTEEERAGYRYPNLHIKRRNLLYTKVDVAFKRGQETEVIVLMEEPVLFQFALLRNQYTTVPATLLCSPVSKTEATLAIENYLLRRITERGKNDGTILLSTVYEKAGIQTKQQRYKAKEKIKNLLDYYKEQGFISDYDICMNDNKAKPEECIKIKKK
ncbi:MAG: hypothetical protein K2J08_06050 [Ruminococcus sp.]|nr:hypothetical protein [Ruminococcus sp.]